MTRDEVQERMGHILELMEDLHIKVLQFPMESGDYEGLALSIRDMTDRLEEEVIVLTVGDAVLDAELKQLAASLYSKLVAIAGDYQTKAEKLTTKFWSNARPTS